MRAGATQFEVRDTDKAHNLFAVKRLARQAAAVDPTALEPASGLTYFRARQPECRGPGGRPEVWWKKHRQGSGR